MTKRVVDFIYPSVNTESEYKLQYSGKSVWLQSQQLVQLLILMFMFAVNAADPVWIGYGGPGTFRVYANAAPPTSFDMTTGKGVKWITPLPSWGHGQPVAVAGKVFVIVEPRPDQIFPSLLCLDQATGKVLWERPLDHLKAAGAESARKELEAWFTRQAELLKQQYGQAKPSPDKSHHDQMRVLNTKMGFQYDTWRVMSPYTRWCFTLSCIGEAFGTPVSDGKRIYACTTWGGYFAFDLDGKPLWTTYAPKKMLHAGGGETGTQRGRSPILHNGLLISDVLNVLRVFDTTSGKLLWSYDLGKGWESMATPQVLTIGGKDVLLTAGIAAFLLPEGKQLKVTGLASPGMQILVKYDEPDVAFFCGSGEHCGWINKGDTDIQPPAAFRFSLSDDTLTGKLLWHGGDLGGKTAWGGNAPWMLYHSGKFYHRDGAIIDALTGKILAGAIDRRSQAVPKTRHLLLWANGYVYGLDNKAMMVYTDDGKPVSMNPVKTPELTAEQRKVIEWATGSEKTLDDPKKKGDFSFSYTFTFDGKRLFLRSYMHLIGIE